MTEFDLPAYLNDHHLICYILIIISSVCITLFAIPSIIYVAHARHLYDDSSHFRKQHTNTIPRLGGVAIFVGFTITLLLFGLTAKTIPVNYVLAACIILFAMGLKDDLFGVNPGTKVVIQLVTAFILVVPGNIRLSSMYGVFGIYNIPYISSVALSILTIIFIINAFNLIDGIDGLAAATGIISNSVFSAMFIYTEQYEMATISLAITGAIIGFLKFNITPAKIFMGDTGSLLIGLVSAVVAITFIEANKIHSYYTPYTPKIYSAPALAMAILIVPIFDALRVFVVRVAKGKSPFRADSNHVHHRMLKLGCTHLQTTGILIIGNIFSIWVAFQFTTYGNVLLIVMVSVMSFTSNWILSYLIRSKERESYTLRNLFQ
jgi:UDP-N-acetylmuramyl pentapeptide phosphotransferase/UDP-N-acetylglucosamine-1-phosphate transferase